MVSRTTGATVHRLIPEILDFIQSERVARSVWPIARGWGSSEAEPRVDQEEEEGSECLMWKRPRCITEGSKVRLERPDSTARLVEV